MISTSPTPLPSENIHLTLPPVPPNPSSKGTSGAAPTEAHKRKVRPSDSPTTSGIPPGLLLRKYIPLFLPSTETKGLLTPCLTFHRPLLLHPVRLYTISWDKLAKLLFRQKLFNSFAPQVSVLTSTLVVSTGSLAITPVAPSSTEALLSPTNIINLESLIPDVDVMDFNSTELLPCGTLAFAPTSLPFLVLVASSLPPFHRPFGSTKFYKLPTLGNITDEEFKKAFELLEDIRELEKSGLVLERDDLAIENGRLLRELDQYSLCYEELQRANVKLKNIISKESAHRGALATKLKEATKKNSNLSLLCSEKEAQIGQLKESLVECQLKLKDQIAHSEKFTMNVVLHFSAIKLGIHRACLEMKSKYSVEHDGKEVLYSYLNTEELILHRFSNLTNNDYPFFKMVDTNSMDVGLLKKHMEDLDSATDVE
ncbi:unnamed protein product [Lactuca virosa]|uniref:Uncharacterized protein n=1 Tax=Lactuca virosa TaxID=75947 RepID=A0AAU9LAI6_9ASTR|nr:unnamed protein product [Lactuca virosa]